MWRKRHFGLIAGLLTVALLGGGCEPLAHLNVENVENGLVVVLPGIDGPSLGTASVMGAVANHTDLAVGQFNWTVPFLALYNQTAYGRNRDMAALLADMIVDYKTRYPGRPVYLIGHSGGTAVAVWSAEALPDGMEVQGIFLLASSLSPGYDLSKAMAKTTDQIVNVYSPNDDALLGNGTRIIGTMDGAHCAAAGKVGFHRRSGWRRGGGELVQMGWTPGMRKVGYHGDHFSVCSGEFIAKYVVPRMGPVPAGPGRRTASMR